MERQENEYLKMLREDQAFKEQTMQEYHNIFKEFTEFVESGECKVKKDEEDERE